MTDLWEAQRAALGAFIREQRKSANLSLRQLAELTSLSNPYLSQVERGLHQPSVRVLKAISDALNVSAETLMAQAGLIDAIATTGKDAKADADTDTKADGDQDTEDAIRADKRLGDEQKAALIAVYRSMLGSAPATDTVQKDTAEKDTVRRTPSRRASRLDHMAQQQRRGHRPDAPRHRAERARYLRDRGVDVPGQPAVRRGVSPHVDHDSPKRNVRGPDQPRPPRRDHQHLRRSSHSG